MSDQVKYGWYSAKAAELYGSAFWRTPNGEEVEVTDVTLDSTGKSYKWKYKVPRGQVIEYVRGEISSRAGEIRDENE